MAKKSINKLKKMAADVQSGSRRALAQAITLIESTRPDHRSNAEQLLVSLIESTGEATRLGISGHQVLENPLSLKRWVFT